MANTPDTQPLHTSSARQSKAWERMEVEALLELLSVAKENGLSHEEAKKRLERYGKNILAHGTDIGILGKVLAQFKSPLVFILLFAGAVTLFLHEYLDAIVIFTALIINVVIGAFQEDRASKAFEKLNQSQEQRALVLRGGKKMNIKAEDLVPGDVVFLESGYHVPADIRIISSRDLNINEAALTGEWVAVVKDEEVIEKEVPLAERRNMAWMGTLLTEGYGLGVVVETGSDTQVGLIAQELAGIEEQVTPLQQNIRYVARFLSYVIAAALVIIFILGLARGEALSDMLLIAIAVAVATIPSGLPAAVTVVLALGMEAILKRGGLVRNLLAAETLGSTTIILTDKTGTLTEAKMKLSNVFSLTRVEQGIHNVDENKVLATEDDTLALTAAALVSDAFIEEGEDAPKKLTVHGRPLEKAVIIGALESGISRETMLLEQKQLDYLSFTSERRFASSLHECPECKAGTHRIYLTGAPEVLLERAQFVRKDGKKKPLSEEERNVLLEALHDLSSKGLRLIGASYKDTDLAIFPEEDDAVVALSEKTVFLGFLVFDDPVREDVIESITLVKGAGARVAMITGDNIETAQSIAQKVGILEPGTQVMLGDAIESLDDEELYEKLSHTSVIARALPSQKLRIARVLRNNGEVVAMTGDGINDAPALRAASIGVAVGAGTEVAKESADLILINNSFSIIVAAIEEGRRIIDNLKKIVTYLLSTSFSEIFVIGGALVFGLPLPLLPSQILWANIVEEGLMSFSFAFEKSDPKAMKRNPRSASAQSLLTGSLRGLIFIVSIVTGVLLIALYLFLLSLELPIEEIRTIMFVSLSLDAIFFTFSLKSLDTPLWRINVFTNTYLLVAFSASVLLLIAALTIPPLQTLLSLTPLTPFEMLLLVGVGVVNLITIEIAKYLFFERRRNS